MSVDGRRGTRKYSSCLRDSFSAEEEERGNILAVYEMVSPQLI